MSKKSSKKKSAEKKNSDKDKSKKKSEKKDKGESKGLEALVSAEENGNLQALVEAFISEGYSRSDAENYASTLALPGYKNYSHNFDFKGYSKRIRELYSNTKIKLSERLKSIYYLVRAFLDTGKAVCQNSRYWSGERRRSKTDRSGMHSGESNGEKDRQRTDRYLFG